VLRGLIDEITLTPRDGALHVDVNGNLAATLAGAFGGGGKTKRPPETGDLFKQVALVAGARNGRYLQLWCGAA